MALTDEERFVLDSAGFLVRHGVLSVAEVAVLREHVERIVLSPDDLAEHERCLPGGRSSFLVGHAAVLDIVCDLLGPDVRLETCEPMWRTRGQAFYRGFHRGSPFQADPVFGYRVEQGRVFLALVRVLIELTDIAEQDGATAFLAGSHKANFALPAAYKEPGGRLAEQSIVLRYACPAGSAIVFPDGVAHTGLEWQRDEPRVAVLCTYSIPSVRYHRPAIPDAVLQSLPADKRAFFRPVWWFDQDVDPPETNTADRFQSDPEPLEARAVRTDRLQRQSVPVGRDDGLR